MRIQDHSNPNLKAMAVAGTHVVLIGWDMPEQIIRSRNVLGWGIQRHRIADGEIIWLTGLKTFEDVDAVPDPGVPVSSFRHPLQTFQWADYTVAPNMTYEYRLVTMKGQPGQLVQDDAVTLRVTTENEEQGRHAVFFNRGAVASQEYARRFQNQPPDVVGQAAFDWLSHGLVEALERYIGQAGQGDELYGAFYEFQSERIYKALRAARTRKAKLHIIYDDRDRKVPNEAALNNNSGLLSAVTPRKHSAGFAHNKFLVLCRGGHAKQVWTGSTNLTNNGMFGHSNNAHIVRDANVADEYLKYWKVLEQDLTNKKTQTAVDPLEPIPATAPFGDTAMAFSPRSDYASLDWYADLAGQAGRGLFMTFAFGMDKRFVDIYDQTDGVLRFALMERKGNGAQYKAQAKEVDRIRRRPNTVVSVGNYITTNLFDRWLKEIDRIQDEVNVRFIHTKYALIDPLGANPTVIVGSANFSQSSSDTNDENMLVVTGNTAIADIYMGEFMRLFSHYAFRESLTFKKIDPESPQALLLKYLAPDHHWIDQRYFRAGSDRALKRAYFSGQ